MSITLPIEEFAHTTSLEDYEAHALLKQPRITVAVVRTGFYNEDTMYSHTGCFVLERKNGLMSVTPGGREDELNGRHELRGKKRDCDVTEEEIITGCVRRGQVQTPKGAPTREVIYVAYPGNARGEGACSVIIEQQFRHMFGKDHVLENSNPKLDVMGNTLDEWDEGTRDPIWDPKYGQAGSWDNY